MKPDKARITAFNVLKRVILSNGYSTIVLDEEFKKAKPSHDEKKLATRIVYGVLERKLTLLAILKRFINRKPKEEIEIILLMGIYQILYLDSIPVYAVVNSSVELAKLTNKNKAAAGFINAVLHKVAKEEPSSLKEEAYKTEEGKYSVSPKMLQIIKTSLKEDADLFLRSSFDRAPIYIRVNTLKTNIDDLIASLNEENIAAERVPLFSLALKISGSYDITKTKAYQNGMFFVQDLSSALAVESLNIEEDSIVLDLCAAPGGKSFLAANYATKGRINSFDIHDHKIELIQKSAMRLGIRNLTAEKKNALDYQGREEIADRIICDVPCSGSGVIRRKPEIRYKDEDLTALYSLQGEILRSASKMLKVGGRLLYSTCSINKKENEDIVREFLKNDSRFGVLNLEGRYDIIKNKGEFGSTVLPSDFGGDGFFFSILERRM